MCEPWANVRRPDTYEEWFDYVGLEGNACRNTVELEEEERPWCYVKGLKVLCDIPECPG